MYRKNVCAVLFNERGELLACHRRDRKAWQCVQGGIDDREQVLAAAWREINEEIGLDATRHGVRYVCEIPPPNGDPTALRYILPPRAGQTIRAQGFIGQEQRLLLFYCPSTMAASVCLCPPPGSLPAVKQEFRSVRWMAISEFLTKVSSHKQAIFDVIATTGLQLAHAFLTRMFGRALAPRRLAAETMCYCMPSIHCAPSATAADAQQCMQQMMCGSAGAALLQETAGELALVHPARHRIDGATCSVNVGPMGDTDPTHDAVASLREMNLILQLLSRVFAAGLRRAAAPRTI